MDEKSGQKLYGPFSIQSIILFFFVLTFLLSAVRMAFVRKRCGGKFGQSVLVNSSPKLIFGTSRYVKVL